MHCHSKHPLPTTQEKTLHMDITRCSTPKKDVVFIRGDGNEKIGSQEIHGVTGKFDLGVQNEAGQRLTEFYQENALS